MCRFDLWRCIQCAVCRLFSDLRYIIIIHTLGQPPHCLTRKAFRKDWCRMRLLPCYDSAIRCSQGMNIHIQSEAAWAGRYATTIQYRARVTSIMPSSFNVAYFEDCSGSLSVCYTFHVSLLGVMLRSRCVIIIRIRSDPFWPWLYFTRRISDENLRGKNDAVSGLGTWPVSQP